ncbi:MAG: efflux RND transporter periplasmic adaptor subunit [Candidatus Caenarcaniphilales bacterium]|nr:efflux RND transporter periplasmic adaptor subunit [Candidatus Caenarcaniphilales bacterium]
MNDERKRTLIIISLIVFLVIGLVVWSTLKQASDAKLVSGTLQAAEVQFGSRQAGRVKKVYVEEGQTLKKGQLILEIENQELINQKMYAEANLNSQIALLAELKNGSTKEALDKAEASYKESKARYELRKSGNRKEDIKSSKATMEMAESERLRARQNLDRKEKLFKQQLITTDQLEEIQKLYKVADKKYEEAKQNYLKVSSGYRREEINENYYRMKSQEANYKDLLRGTRVERIQAEESRLKAYEAQLKELESKVKELEVRSTCNCELADFEIEPGDLLLSNQTLGVLVNLNDVWVEAYLPEETFGKVWPGDKVKVTSLTYKGKTYIGRVKHIGVKSEFTPRNIQTIEGRKQQVYKVKVTIDNSHKLFRPGMDLELRFDLNKRKG